MVDSMLLWVPSSSVRRTLHAARHTAYADNEAVLEQLIAARDRYARLMGFPSYTHYHTHAQLAKVHATHLPHHPAIQHTHSEHRS